MGSAAAPSFGASVALPSSTYYGEPSLATAPDGTLVIVAPCSNTCAWRSVDHGSHWARVANSRGSSGDSDVAFDAAGTMYVSDLFNDVPVSVSTNDGTSYDYSTPSMATNNVDRQWLATSGAGTVWSAVHNTGAGGFDVAKSTDSARTWHRVTAFNDADFPPPGQLIAASASDLYEPYASTNGYVRVAASHDGGSTWRSVNVARYVASAPLGDTAIFPTVAADAAGTLYLAWADASAPRSPTQPVDGTRVQLSVSHDKGASWSAPLALSSPDDYAIDPWVAADAAGRVAVSWYDGAPPALVQTAPGVADLVSWYVKVAFSADADGATPHWTAQRATGVTHTGPICETGTGCAPQSNPVAQNRALLDFFEMGEQSDGSLAIAYAGDQPTVQGQLTGVYTQLNFVGQDGGPNLKV